MQPVFKQWRQYLTEQQNITYAENYINKLLDYTRLDQAERKEYKVYLEKYGWPKARDEYAKAKNRSPDDLFGEMARSKDAIKIIKNNLQNLKKLAQTNTKLKNAIFLLVQHADRDRKFQLQVLKSGIFPPPGPVSTEDQNFMYLHDRLTCAQFKQQIFGTQNGCKCVELNNVQKYRLVNFNITPDDASILRQTHGRCK
jgi:hypothetical protein